MTIDELVAKQEITEVMYRYCQAVDRADWDGVRACYHEDAYDAHGVYSGPVKGLYPYMIKRHESLEQSLHFIGNILIDDLDLGADPPHAYVEAYCLAMQRMKPGAEHVPAMFEELDVDAVRNGSRTVEMAVRYVDHYTKRDGAWRVQDRTVVYEYVRGIVRDDTSAIAPGSVVVKRGREDALYAMRQWPVSRD